MVNIKNASAKKRLESAAGVKRRCHCHFSGCCLRARKKGLPLTAAVLLKRRKLLCKGRRTQPGSSGIALA